MIYFHLIMPISSVLKLYSILLSCIISHCFFMVLTCNFISLQVTEPSVTSIFKLIKIVNPIYVTIEKKNFLDLKYRCKSDVDTKLFFRHVLISTDVESKLFGCKYICRQKNFPQVIVKTCGTNKKLLNSTLFGNFKLEKL